MLWLGRWTTLNLRRPAWRPYSHENSLREHLDFLLGPLPVRPFPESRNKWHCPSCTPNPLQMHHVTCFPVLMQNCCFLAGRNCLNPLEQMVARVSFQSRTAPAVTGSSASHTSTHIPPVAGCWSIQLLHAVFLFLPLPLILQLIQGWCLRSSNSF